MIFDEAYNKLKFNTVYSDLEKCLQSYLLIRTSGGWTAKVNVFKREKLPIIYAKKDLSILMSETKVFSKSVGSNFAWMPCAAGSILRESLDSFLSKVEKDYAAYQGSLPQNIPIEHRATLPIPIPGVFILNSYRPSLSPSSCSQQEKVVFSVSGAIEVTLDTEQTQDTELPTEVPALAIQINSQQWVPVQHKQKNPRV